MNYELFYDSLFQILSQVCSHLSSSTISSRTGKNRRAKRLNFMTGSSLLSSVQKELPENRVFRYSKIFFPGVIRQIFVRQDRVEALLVLRGKRLIQRLDFFFQKFFFLCRSKLSTLSFCNDVIDLSLHLIFGEKFPV